MFSLSQFILFYFVSKYLLLFYEVGCEQQIGE